MKHLGDITKINWFEVEPVDVVTGGSPCQDLSVAGKRAGLAGERSGLYMEQIRCIKELRQADEQRGRTGAMVRPRYMVWENVPGAFSSNGGKDFAAVIEEAVRVVEPKAPAVPVPEKGWPSAGCLYDDMGRWSVAWRVHDAQYWGVPQRRKRIALVCDFAGRSAPEVLFEREGLSVDFELCGAAREEAAGAVGGGVEGAGGFANNGNRCQPLTAEAHPPAVVCAGFKHNQGVAGSIGYQEEVAPTLTAEQKSAVYDLDQISMADQANTLDTMHDQQCAMVGASISARDYKGLCRQDLGNNLANYPIKGNAVRRLTPLERERMHGYPDGWTDIGDWTDSKGKRHKTADSPRYKALGNSIAIPFWFWLLRRISAQYARPATLGSLFDGIGGFPLCWERCNGEGTARWASEIEEFPMAVTRLRFGEEANNE